MKMLVLSCLLLVFPPILAAQSAFEGGYSLQTPDGGSIVLRLAPAGSGAWSGTMTNGSVEWQINGELDEDTLFGTVSTGQSILAFEAYADASNLELILAERGPDGMPDVDNAEQFMFTRLQPGEQVAGQSAGQPAAGRAGQQPVAGRAGQRPAGQSAARAGTDTSNPLAAEWQQHLAGKKVTYISSYSSNTPGGGGMSTKQVYHLCSDGSFAFSDDSSISINSGMSADLGTPGSADRGSGTWRIITEGQLAGIELRYHSGEAYVSRLEYKDGATFADGSRVYVTPGELCR